MMAKAERGTKRVCRECGGKVYDLNSDPAACPLCGAVQTNEEPAAQASAPAEEKQETEPAETEAAGAAAAGAEVFASASPQTTDIAEQLGADTVVDYKSGDFAEAIDEETDGKGVDLVIDTVGGGLLEQSIEALADHGRMVDIVGDPGDVGPTGKLANATVEFMALTRTKETITAVRRLALREQIVPVIDSEYPLEEVAAAHQALEEGGITGKIVLRIHE
jgi:uncharacterized protein (TIGR02300 family)